MAEAAVDNPVIVNMSGSAQYYLKYLPFLYLVRPDVYAMFDHVHNMWSAGAGISRLGRSMVLLDPTLRNESHKMVLLGSNFDSKSQSKSPILTFPSPDDKVKIKCMLKLKCESQRSSGFYKLQPGNNSDLNCTLQSEHRQTLLHVWRHSMPWPARGRSVMAWPGRLGQSFHNQQTIHNSNSYLVPCLQRH